MWGDSLGRKELSKTLAANGLWSRLQRQCKPLPSSMHSRLNRSGNVLPVYVPCALTGLLLSLSCCCISLPSFLLV